MKRIISVLLCLLMLVSIAQVSVSAFSFENEGSSDGFYNVVSKKDYNIAPGIEESEIVLTNAGDTRRQVLHFMEADLNNEYTKVIASYNKMDSSNFSVADMMKQATWVEENWGLNVVGAMNTTLSWYTGDRYVKNPSLVGEPLGVMIVDGELYYDQCVGFPTVVVINKDEKDGVARPADMPKVEMKQVASTAALTGWEDQVIPISSGYLVKDGVNQYSVNHGTDTASRSVVGIKADGTVVIMMNDGRQSPYSLGMTMYELAEAMIAAGCVYAANCDGGGSSQFLSKRPGDSGLTINCSPSDGALRETTNGILFISTAPSDGSFYRAHVTTEDDYYTPGSSVQFNAVGMDFSGSAAEIPADAVWQLADTSMGTIDNNGLFTSNGTQGTATAQLVYQDEVVGEASVNIVIPDIAFGTPQLVLPFGQASTLSVKASTNEGLNEVVLKDGDIAYSVSDPALGTIDGDVITTAGIDSTVTEGTVTAVPCGDSSKAVSVPLKLGKASEIKYDFENDYELLVDADILNPIKAENGTYWNNRWALHPIQGDQYWGYRHGASSRATPLGPDMRGELYLVDSTTGKVRNGEHALAAKIDWTYVTSMGTKQMDMWLPEPWDVSDSTSFGFWIYLPEAFLRGGSANFIRIYGITDKATNKAGNTDIKLSTLTNSGVDKEGWYYLNYNNTGSLQFSDVRYFQFACCDVSTTHYNAMPDCTFYLDDFTVDYSSAAIDRANPYFTSMSIANEYDSYDEVNGQTINSNNVILSAQAYENKALSNYTGINTKSAVLYVDGVKYDGDVTVSASGKVTVADLYLNDGVHTLRMEISDNQGNTGSINRKLTVKSKDSVVNVSLELPKDGSNPLAGSIVPLNLTADLSAITSVTTTLSLDGMNEWELEGMSVPYGFEYSYSVNANNDATVTITKTLADADCSGNVLATLPIRIWTAKGYLDPTRAPYVKDNTAYQDKYWVLTPYAMWLTDGVCKIELQVEAETGVATLADGSTKTFSSDMNKKMTELNRYRNSKNDGDANFWQDKASFHIHEAGEPQSKAATCTQAGYENRVFCVGCACDKTKGYGCDSEDGCGSVVDWGTTIPATGHTYAFDDDGVLKCADCDKLFNGEYTDGKVYIDGVIANGWVDNTYYYIDGVKVTGQYVMDNKMYTFDENGVYDADANFTGFYQDDIGWRYFRQNDMFMGFTVIDGDTYYFNEYGKNKGYAPVGTYDMGGIRTYTFEGEQGKCLGAWDYVTGTGTRYYYSYRFYKNVFVEIDGETYYFDNDGYKVTGTRCLTKLGNFVGGYEFDNDGKLVTPITGAFTDDVTGYSYYAEDGVIATNKLCYDGKDYYFARNNGLLCTWATTLTEAQVGDTGVAPGTYTFGADGKMIRQEGPVVCDWNPDYWYFFKDNQRVTKEGLYEYNGDYYYVRNNGLLLTWERTIEEAYTNGLVAAGTYNFDSDGKMVKIEGPGVCDWNSEYLYFYKDNKRVTKEGLYEYNGDYYYVRNNGLLLTWEKTLEEAYTNGLVTAGTYSFGADGKMAKVEGPGPCDWNADYLYFYKDYKRVTKEGLYEYNGDYYYVRNNGLLLTWEKTLEEPYTNGLVAAGTYSFGADGKMAKVEGPGPCDWNADYLYFYKDYKRVTKEGLYEYNGDYYYVRNNGLLLTWEKTLEEPYTNGLVAPGTYSFGADGKMVKMEGPGPCDWNADYMYFYKDNKRVKAEGLYEYNGDYYYVRNNGLLLTWEREIAEEFTNGLVPAGKYVFGADGKMVNPPVA